MEERQSRQNSNDDLIEEESIDFLRNAHRRDTTLVFRAFLFTVFLSAPFVVYELAIWFDSTFYFPPLAQLILATLILFGPGFLVYRSAYGELKIKKIGVNFLISMGASIAFGFSLAIYLWHLSFLFYFGMSSLLVLIALWGQWLKELMKRSQLLVREKYQHVLPTTTKIDKNGRIEEILTSFIHKDDFFRVEKGDYIPADAIVIQGQGIVNESILNGKSSLKEAGIKLFAGTWVEEGSFKARATQVGKNTALLKILNLIQHAPKSLNDSFDFFNKIIPVYFVFWLLVVLGTWIGWALTGLYLEGFLNAMTVFIVGCPSALGLIASSALLIASEVGARHGALFKEPTVLIQIHKIKTLIFEKDSLRKMSGKAISKLRQRDIHIIMLTSDSKETALESASKIKIKDCRFDLLPHEQAKEVLLAKSEGKKVGMVGNGIYDVLALIQSDVSFTIGENQTLELADVTLKRSDPMSIVDVIDLSRMTMRKIKQNMFLAFFFHVFAIPIAASGALSPAIAMGTIAVSVISIFANTLIMRYWKP